MAFFSDYARDLALAAIRTDADQLHLCSQEPTTDGEVDTYTLGVISGPVINAPEDGTTGRKIVIPAQGGGSVTATGTATHWALVDNGTRLLNTGALSAAIGVDSGNTWATQSELPIELPAAVQI